MIHNASYAVCGFTLILCLTGCGRRDGLIEIGGTVTFDGQPLQKGNITFLPVDGNGPTAAAIIADGKYAVKAASGKKQVRIEGFKVVGRRHYYPKDPSSPMVDVLEKLLPDRYNTNSQLTQEIASGTRVYDFALTK